MLSARAAGFAPRRTAAFVSALAAQSPTGTEERPRAAPRHPRSYRGKHRHPPSKLFRPRASASRPSRPPRLPRCLPRRPGRPGRPRRTRSARATRAGSTARCAWLCVCVCVCVCLCVSQSVSLCLSFSDSLSLCLSRSAAGTRTRSTPGRGSASKRRRRACGRRGRDEILRTDQESQNSSSIALVISAMAATV